MTVRLEIGVFPVSTEHRAAPDHRPVCTLMPADASWIDDRTPLRDKMRVKANRYGRIRRRMVITIDGANRHLDNIDVMDALFGGRPSPFRVPLRARSASIHYIETPTDLFSPRGPATSVSRRCSSFPSLSPWTVAVSESVLYFNPSARHPLLPGMDAMTRHHAVERNIVLERGAPIHTVLDLPQRWPSAARRLVTCVG